MFQLPLTRLRLAAPAVTVLFGLLTVTAFVQPLLSAARIEPLASGLFTFLSVLCLQRPSHSFFILGHQMPVEQRLVALYTGLALAGGSYLRLRGRVRGLDIRAGLLLAAPITADGLRGVLSAVDSDPLTRTWTAAAFALGFVWVVYPRLDWPSLRLAGWPWLGARLGPLRPQAVTRTGS